MPNDGRLKHSKHSYALKEIGFPLNLKSNLASLMYQPLNDMPSSLSMGMIGGTYIGPLGRAA